MQTKNCNKCLNNNLGTIAEDFLPVLCRKIDNITLLALWTLAYRVKINIVTNNVIHLLILSKDLTK